MASQTRTIALLLSLVILPCLSAGGLLCFAGFECLGGFVLITWLFDVPGRTYPQRKILGCSVVSVSSAGLHNAEEEAFGRAVNNAFASADGCGKITATAKVEFWIWM